MMKIRGRGVTAVVLVAFSAAVLIGCSSGSNSKAHDSTVPRAASTSTTVPVTHAVGLVTETYVDHSRPTAAAGNEPNLDSRTLPTSIYYPAEGAAGDTKPTKGTTPDTKGGPYPLIVFGHGLGANPSMYEHLLASWASAGFVVAAPTFPLSNSNAPGGPSAGDVASQPGDMTFVIDEVLAASKGTDGPLAGLVNPAKIGAAGHSYGAVTTVGLIGHPCCTDKRVKAAVVMAGAMAPMGPGKYDLAKAPPLLVVHGTDDSLIDYNEGVAIFNAARGPKALVTIKGGDHMAAAGGTGATVDPVVGHATIDFFRGYLDGDSAALDRLDHDGKKGVATVNFARAKGSEVTVPRTDGGVRHLKADATPTEGLTNGQTITVNWNGYTPGKVVNILQCSAVNANLDNQAGCDFSHAKLLHGDPTGKGSLEMQVITGAVGSGTCDAQHQGCFIVVDDASSPSPDAMVKIPITFAG